MLIEFHALVGMHTLIRPGLTRKVLGLDVGVLGAACVLALLLRGLWSRRHSRSLGLSVSCAVCVSCGAEAALQDQRAREA